MIESGVLLSIRRTPTGSRAAISQSTPGERLRQLGGEGDGTGKTVA
jgi:hypothetical protein